MKEVLYTLSPGYYQRTLFVKVYKNKETGNSHINSVFFINHFVDCIYPVIERNPGKKEIMSYELSEVWNVTLFIISTLFPHPSASPSRGNSQSNVPLHPTKIY